MIERAEKQWIGRVGVPEWSKVVTLSALTSLTIVVTGCNANKPSATPVTVNINTISVKTAPVVEETIDVIRELSGTTSSEFHSVLAASVSGRVLAVNVTDGTFVQQGQALVQLDARHFQAGKQAAVGSLGRSRAEVTKARTALDLEKASSIARVQEAEASLTAAKAALAIANERRSITAEGARSQELAQSRSAVVQADASLKLAKLENDRIRG